MRKSLLSLVVSSILSLSLFSNAASGVEHYVIRIGGDIEGIKAEEGGSTGGETEKPGEEEKEPGDGRLPGTLGIGNTCAEILNKGKSGGDGDYTVLITGTKKAVYCDMTTRSGGWMLLNDYGSDVPFKNALGKVGINTHKDTTGTFSLSSMLMNFNGVPQQETPVAGTIWNRGDSVSFNNPKGMATATIRNPGYGTAIRIDAPRVGATNIWEIKITNPIRSFDSVDGSFGGTQIITYWNLTPSTVINIYETNGVIQLDKVWIR